MSIVIFGGNGFLGRHLVDSLKKQNEDIIVCDLECTNKQDGCKFVEIDVRYISNFSKLDLSSNDIVVNLAANQYHQKVPRKNRDEYFFETNTKGTENILKHMERCGCKKLIMFTTDMTYGKPQYLPVDTKHQQKPFGPYGQSKKAAEDICREYRNKGFDITIFRPRMIIGPGRLGILKKLFLLIKLNLPVPTIGNGRNCYQMISVFDCVTAIELAIKKGIPNKEYNLGSYNPPSTRDLLKGLAKHVGSKSFIVPTYGPLVKFVLKGLGMVGLELMYKEQYMIADENYILDITETVNDLGWKPAFSDTDMIIEAYKEYRGGIKH